MSYELKRYRQRLERLEGEAKERYPDLTGATFVEHAVNAWMRCAWEAGTAEALAREIIDYTADLESNLPDILNDYVGDALEHCSLTYGVKRGSVKTAREWLMKQGYLPDETVREPVDVGC